MDNSVILQAFETQLPDDGSLWRTIAGRAGELASMGISALWIPPAWKGAGGGGANGYDVYDLYDLGEFRQKGSVRTKYGTLEELIAAIGALHDAGIKVYADVVLNHRFGGNQKECLDFARLRCAIGDQPDVTVGADGSADFTVGGRRCAVFVPVEAKTSL